MAELVTIVYCCVAVLPPESATLIVKVSVPTVVGVPVIAPLLAFRVSPSGMLPPATTLNVLGVLPPVVATVWLYPALFTVQLLSDVVEIATAELIVTVYGSVAVEPAVSVTLIVNEFAP